MRKDDKEAHKVYIWIMNMQFSMLVNKFIEIINYMLKSENWTKYYICYLYYISYLDIYMRF